MARAIQEEWSEISRGRGATSIDYSLALCLAYAAFSAIKLSDHKAEVDSHEPVEHDEYAEVERIG